MSLAHKSRPALRDIDGITSYIARDSVEAALRWLVELDRFLNRIAAAPGMGTRHDDISRGLRSVSFGNYLIFFRRRRRREIEIVRIIHGARRWRRLLGKSE